MANTPNPLAGVLRKFGIDLTELENQARAIVATTQHEVEKIQTDIATIKNQQQKLLAMLAALCDAQNISSEMIEHAGRNHNGNDANRNAIVTNGGR